MEKFGTCKLTGDVGSFVDAHILPKALTRPEAPGKPFLQFGEGYRRPVTRFSSWYDNQLVTQRGEDILKKLDTWAIVELRKHRLVWSGWEDGQSPEIGQRLSGTGFGVRVIEGLDQSKLRLFFLSLLWRAAASRRPEFQEIILPEPHLEQLRMMIVESNPSPISFYSVTLIQLSTLGPVHNLTPVPMTKRIPAFSGDPERTVPIYRFYFDGLVAHFHRQASDGAESVYDGPVILGGDTKLAVTTVTFERSMQMENAMALIREGYRLM